MWTKIKIIRPSYRTGPSQEFSSKSVKWLPIRNTEAGRQKRSPYYELIFLYLVLKNKYTAQVNLREILTIFKINENLFLQPQIARRME
jgi:hypothetical protein